MLPGPTGESNEHYYEGRGVFLCISPWNFPLAIFTGQICAALVAGNTVLAKPAEQTSLIAGRTIELFHQAGVPTEVLHYLPGDGATLGNALLPDERLVGVAFTGSTETAHRINRTLAERSGAIPTLIAETGGQNAMIVDSTALPEQVVADVMQSAFASAGQRCSALRVLCVQEDIADRIIELIGGALGRLKIGNPQYYATDSGPVIDAEAHQALLHYVRGLARQRPRTGRSRAGRGHRGRAIFWRRWRWRSKVFMRSAVSSSAPSCTSTVSRVRIWIRSSPTSTTPATA